MILVIMLNEKTILHDYYFMFLNVLCLRPEEFEDFCLTNYDKFAMIVNYKGCYATHYSTLLHVLLTCAGEFIPEAENQHLLWHKDYSIEQNTAKNIFDFLLEHQANPYLKDYYNETVIDLAKNENFLSRRWNNERFIGYVREYFNIPKIIFN